ncbi:CPBP family intramembrane glutamic endopeptidase [Thermoproteota archaeon]
MKKAIVNYAKQFGKTQKIAIVLSPVLFLVMFAVYQGFSRILGNSLGWYAGFAIYWPIFCVTIPLWLVGSNRIIERYKIFKINPKYLLVYLFPVFMTLIGGLFMSNTERDTIGLIIWLGMSVGNGLFEEILWRGVYPILFPDNKLFGFAWPAIWFSIWHFAPGSLSQNFQPIVLVSGALMLGLSFGWGAFKTKSLFWASIGHTFSGLFQLIWNVI